MTGLNPETHVILEIGTLVTDSDLDIIGEGPNLAISYPESVLSSMDDWSREHHESSGLMRRVEKSSITCRQAEEETVKFLSLHCKKGDSPLCGNTIWQDRRFLAKYMPLLDAFCHYRIIDVSSVKELAKRWYPTLAKFEKEKAHLALSDIQESIKELKYYREHVFKG
jgi:oligoribonuclease